MSRPRRTVHEGCALAWLAQHPLPDDAAVLTSLPNVDEFGHKDLATWRTWFASAAEAVLRATPERSAAIFFQTDVEHDGVWIDKSYLLQTAAERTATPLLWHKVALRAPVGTATGPRPGFAHLLCFSKELRRSRDNDTADVLPSLGEQDWPRAMGRDVAAFAVGWLRQHTAARTIVAPFCGTGTALDAATEAGLDTIGIERNPSRARRARALTPML